MKKPKGKPSIKRAVKLTLSDAELSHLDSKVKQTDMSRLQYIRHRLREFGDLPIKEVSTK